MKIGIRFRWVEGGPKVTVQALAGEISSNRGIRRIVCKGAGHFHRAEARRETSLLDGRSLLPLFRSVCGGSNRSGQSLHHRNRNGNLWIRALGDGKDSAWGVL